MAAMSAASLQIEEELATLEALARRVQQEAIRLLVEAGVYVNCAGAGGIPVVRGEDGKMEGVEAVIDKDRASALLAKALQADILLMLTDVEAVFRDWGGPDQAAIGSVAPDTLDAMVFAAGSMGPKITAACDFVRAGGSMAGIGRLQDARAIVEGRAGGQVRLVPATPGNRLAREKETARVAGHQPGPVQQTV